MPNPTGQPLVPLTPVRKGPRQRWSSAFGGSLPGQVYAQAIVRDAQPRRRQPAGRVLQPSRILIPTPAVPGMLVPVTPVRKGPRQWWRAAVGALGPVVSYRPIIRDSRHGARRVAGVVRMRPTGAPQAAPVVLLAGITRPIRDIQPQRRRPAGAAYQSTRILIPTPAPSGLLVPVTPVRWVQRQFWRIVGGGLGPRVIYRPIVQDSRPFARRIAGKVWQARLPQNPVIYPWRPLVGGQPRRRGSVYRPILIGPATPPTAFRAWKTITVTIPWRAGRAWFPRYLSTQQPSRPFAIPVRIARDAIPFRRRIAGWSWLERFASPGIPQIQAINLTDPDSCYLVPISSVDRGGFAEADQDGCYLVGITSADSGLAEADQDGAYLTA
jgi:hypothetical protein